MSIETVEIRAFSGPDLVNLVGGERPAIVRLNVGPKGDAGANGTNGTNGGSTSAWNYKANTNDTSGYPSNGYLLWNNATQTSATSINVSHLSDDDTDIELFLSFFVVGQKIFIQNRDDSGQNQVWQISGTPTVTDANTDTAFYTFPVTLVSSAGLAFNNNHSILFGGISIATNAVTSATTSNGTCALTLASLSSSGNIYTGGEFANIYTTGESAYIYTTGAAAEIYTSGFSAHIRTAGASATIYTDGDGASIYTTGSDASISTAGVNATINTQGASANIETQHSSASVKSSNFASNTSAGSSLKNTGGTACLSWGAGGGQNLTIPSGTGVLLNATSYTYGTGAAAAHKTALSLNNVDNTSDASKPVSTAQQTALNLKANLTANTFTASQIIYAASNQLRVGVSAANFVGMSCVNGQLQFACTGSNPSVRFSDIMYNTASFLATNASGFNYVGIGANDTICKVFTSTGSAVKTIRIMPNDADMLAVTIAGVGIGIVTPNAKSILDLTSTTQGFLPPRMTTTQRDAITSVPSGLMVYNTTTNKINFYNGSAWEAVTSA